MTTAVFSPADAEDLTAWFVKAEANAVGLRRRLRDLMLTHDLSPSRI
jgi:hypothetical protein